MPIVKTQSIWHTLFRLLLLFLPFGIFGLATGYLLEISVVFLIAIVLFHYSQIFKLNNWLWTKRGRYPPKSIGLWASIYDGIYRQQRRNTKKRNELTALIRQFRVGSEALPDGVVIFDRYRQIFWCNKMAQDLLGLQWPKDQGVRIDNLIRKPLFIEYLNQYAYDVPLKLASPENEAYVLEFRVVPFEQDKWVLIVRDITKINELDQMRKDFIANVSHELKTPLTVMRGYLEMTENIEHTDAPIWQKAHSMMVEQTTRMDDLVSKLLSLSKMEQSSGNIEKESINLSKTINVLVEEAKALSAGNHTISSNIDESIKIYGNESELRSACSNLVFNAVRYTPEGGKINIEWKRQGLYALFSVTDNGEGIEANHIPRLTERFYRVDEARQRSTGGAGLGLSIVKHALVHHNSHLSIESEKGRGSRFSFKILIN